MCWLSYVATLAAIVLAPTLAMAQQRATPEPADRAEGRAEFEAGLRAAREGDWAIAHDRFARAFELAPQPSVLMNLAGAQRQTGRLLAAAASYRRWLVEATSERDARHRASVEEVLARVEAAIPRLTVVASGLAPEDELRLDGTSAVEVEREIPLDPGAHTIAVLRAGSPIVRRSVHLREGERERIVLELPRPSAVDRGLAGADHERRIEGAMLTVPERPEGDDPTGWIVVGTAAGVAVIAGVVIGVVLATSTGTQPYAGNVPPGTWEVR